MARFEFVERDYTHESSNPRQQNNVHIIRDDIDVNSQKSRIPTLNYKSAIGFLALLFIIFIFFSLKGNQTKPLTKSIQATPSPVYLDINKKKIKNIPLLIPPEKTKLNVAKNVKSSLKHEKNQINKTSVKKPKNTAIPIKEFKISVINKTLIKCKEKRKRYRCISSLELDINFTGTKSNELRLVIQTPKKRHFIDKVTKLKKIFINFNEELYLKGVYKIKLYNTSNKLLYVDSFKVR